MFLINVQLKGNLEVMCNYQDQLIGVLFVPYSPWNSHEKKWQADKPLQWQKHSHTPVNSEISTVYRRQRLELERQHKVPCKGREGKGSPRTKTIGSIQGLQGRKCIPGHPPDQCARGKAWKKGWEIKLGAWTCARALSSSEAGGGVFGLYLLAVFPYCLMEWLKTAYKSHKIKGGRHNQLF